MHELKCEVRDLLLQSQSLERILLRLLDDDERLQAMYLTRLRTSPNAAGSYHSFRKRPVTASFTRMSSATRLSTHESSSMHSARAGAVAGLEKCVSDEFGHDEAETMFESYVLVRLLVLGGCSACQLYVSSVLGGDAHCRTGLGLGISSRLSA